MNIISYVLGKPSYYYKHTEIELTQLDEPELQNNLETAREVCNYVNSKVLYSTNIQTSLLKWEIKILKENNKDDSIHLIDKFMDNKVAILTKLQRAFGDVIKNKSELEEQVKYIEANGIGNCSEKSKVAYVHGYKKFPHKKFEIFRIAGGEHFSWTCKQKCRHKGTHRGDHVFVVIGRANGSNPNDYTTWGRRAVVLDSWRNELHRQVFPAFEIASKLQNYVNSDQDQKTRELWTRLEPYNPKKHRLLLKEVPD